MDSPIPRREILFEGLQEQEILDLPKEAVEQLVMLGEPLVFLAGSAVILGSFKVHTTRLTIELAQIDGGEGVLTALSSLARRYCKLHDLSEIEWIVHAVSCAKPNLKLRRVLERRGFSIRELPSTAEAYYFVDAL